jgi:hypothetical protein
MTGIDPVSLLGLITIPAADYPDRTLRPQCATIMSGVAAGLRVGITEPHGAGQNSRRGTNARVQGRPKPPSAMKSPRQRLRN